MKWGWLLPRHMQWAQHAYVFDVQVACGQGSLTLPAIRGLNVERIAEHEPGVQRTIQRVLAAGDGAFIDVGANIGQTLFKVLAADRNRQYIGFEVQSFCCSLIDQIIELNRLNRCLILPVGLSDRPGVVTLHRSALEDSCATIVPGFRGGGAYDRTTAVMVERGDDVLARLGVERVAAIKIDVEGHEPEVLKGLQATVATHRPFVIVEILPFSHVTADPLFPAKERSRIVEMRQASHSLLQEFLRSSDYSAKRILPDATTTPVEHFDQSAYREGYCDYLLEPLERPLGPATISADDGR